MEMSIENQMKLEAAKSKKYYRFTISYDRYNPQLGTYESSTTEIAKTPAEALRKVKKSFADCVYGSACVKEVIGKEGPLVLGKDYDLELKEKVILNKAYFHTGKYEVVVKELYNH